MEALNTSTQARALLTDLRELYTEPIVTLDSTEGMEAQLEALKAHPGKGCTDFELLSMITAYVVENMVERLGSHFMPHHTQILTILLFLESNRLHPKEGGGNVVAEVGTGEGKSLIISMLAAFHVLRGCPRVNVLVDNISLLERDFSTFEPLFQAMGIKSCSAANKASVEADMQVCYHTAHSLEVQYLKGLTGESEHPITENAVLIVDEVDGLIVDEDVNRSYVYEDKKASDLLNQGLERTRRGGKSLRYHLGKKHAALAESVEQAQAEMKEKVNGQDYTIDSKVKKCKMLDRFGRPRDSAYELWLELLNNQQFKTPVRYLSPQFLLSRPYVLKKHSKIIGLSGSLGNEAEQDFVKSTYECELLHVPAFLDCCRGQKKERPTCRGVFKEETEEAYFQRLSKLAIEYRDRGVPVVIIMKNDDMVSQLVTKHLCTELGEEALESKEVNTISSALFSENRSKFKDVIDNAARLSTTGKYRITCTSPIGGRGQDYRVLDDAVDVNGGLMLIVGFIPESEREYVQFLGRTGRQDKKGQFAAVLLANDYVGLDLAQASSGEDSTESDLRIIRRILADGNERTKETLRAQSEVLRKGQVVNEVCERVFPKREEPGFDTEQWVDMIRNYRDLTNESILSRAMKVEDGITRR
ncbi:hypothetical protein CYMTET_23979 [Cymbomonas tetramitiformis]|uniref:chloroplast protein-transporting ATPase n=1 Tax=Cymbomonas tetramitiformis TaxID=36881 RepID=A0AAE0L0E2_9CHLO|nr:hypothetical protein CYMTET_23979 [Cymbomonas tetramitiformis]